jgi:hypothetical protein
LVVRGPCTHLAGAVKSNSSGIEVWRGSLIQAGSNQEVLDRGAVDALNPPQRGLGVTVKSSTPRVKLSPLPPTPAARRAGRPHPATSLERGESRSSRGRERRDSERGGRREEE